MTEPDDYAAFYPEPNRARPPDLSWTDAEWQDYTALFPDERPTATNTKETNR